MEVGLLVLFTALLFISAKVGEGLSLDYYAFRCPFAESIVRETVDRAMQRDITTAAGLLRMHFHDCFVEGCDASILIDSTRDNKAEKDSPANLSLHGYEIIDEAKQRIEQSCPGVVSCADIIAIAARDAVVLAGGPMYDVPKGRKDGSRSKIEDTRNLPAPTLDASQLIKAFTQHGLSVQEMVALSGGHTLGVARCSSFKNRLAKFDSAHDVDPSINSQFLATLKRSCIKTSSDIDDNATVAFDSTKNMFDNSYYMNIQSGAGLLTSDQTLLSSPKTRGIVNMYAMNQASFFFDFSQAMIRMGVVDVKEDDEGDIRLNCHKLN
eukprot:Gb_17935 [translate_table: standard]